MWNMDPVIREAEFDLLLLHCPHPDAINGEVAWARSARGRFGNGLNLDPELLRSKFVLCLGGFSRLDAVRHTDRHEATREESRTHDLLQYRTVSEHYLVTRMYRSNR